MKTLLKIIRDLFMSLFQKLNDDPYEVWIEEEFPTEYKAMKQNRKGYRKKPSDGWGAL